MNAHKFPQPPPILYATTAYPALRGKKRNVVMPLVLYFLLFLPLAWLVQENPMVFVWPFTFILACMALSLYSLFKEDVQQRRCVGNCHLLKYQQELIQQSAAQTSDIGIQPVEQKVQITVESPKNRNEEAFRTQKRRGAGRYCPPPLSPSQREVPFEKTVREHVDMQVPITENLNVPSAFPTLLDELSDSMSETDDDHLLDIPTIRAKSSTSKRKRRKPLATIRNVNESTAVFNPQRSLEVGPVAAMQPLQRIRSKELAKTADNSPDLGDVLRTVLDRMDSMTDMIMTMKTSNTALEDKLEPFINGKIETYLHNLEQVAIMVSQNQTNPNVLNHMAHSLHNIRQMVEDMVERKAETDRVLLVGLCNTVQLALSNTLDVLVGPKHDRKHSLPEQLKRITRDLGYIRMAVVDRESSESDTNPAASASSEELGRAGSSTLSLKLPQLFAEEPDDDTGSPVFGEFDDSLLTPMNGSKWRGLEEELGEMDDMDTTIIDESDPPHERMIQRPTTPEPGRRSRRSSPDVQIIENDRKEKDKDIGGETETEGEDGETATEKGKKEEGQGSKDSDSAEDGNAEEAFDGLVFVERQWGASGGGDVEPEVTA